jgi:hypothetical protein
MLLVENWLILSRPTLMENQLIESDAAHSTPDS